MLKEKVILEMELKIQFQIFQCLHMLYEQVLP